MGGTAATTGGQPSPDRAAAVAAKVRRVRELMRAQGAVACVLARVANFAWISCGGRSFVNVATDAGAAWVVITADRVAVLTSNIEADRLREEELTGLDWDMLAYPWWERDGSAPLLRELTGGGPILADVPLQGASDAAPQVAALRCRLDPYEQARAVDVGREAALALEGCCREIQPGDTESGVAGRLAAACLARGLEPHVHLVAADGRAYARRHPLPTRAAVERYVLVAVSAMGEGLVVSATRLVHWGAVPPDLHRRWRAAAQVDAEMMAASLPGARAADIFAIAQAAYADAGFPDEWRHHHQGGLAGYASREWRALPDGQESLADGQMCAWNPSVAGAKSEDTLLVRPAGRPRILTASGQWPCATLRTASGSTVERPEILVVA